MNCPTMNSKAVYAISELAKHFGVTTRTIRYYEDQGMLAPKRQNNIRIYDERDRVRLQLILRGKRLGFSLSEIRETLKLYDSSPNKKVQLDYVLEIIDAHRSELLQKQRDIKRTLADMKKVETRIRDKLKSMT